MTLLLAAVLTSAAAAANVALVGAFADRFGVNSQNAPVLAAVHA